MSDPRTHYEVLGLEPGATADEIRKRFRELARKYHPDRHADSPEFHELFIRISQAYEVLNDGTKRAYYDLELRDKSRRGTIGSSPHGAGPRPGPPAGPAYRGGPSQQQQHSEAARRRDDARQKEDGVRRQQAIARLMEDARIAFARGHLRDAQALCHEALQLANVGPAHEMLGDIASRQGRPDEAIRHYTVAAQMSPNSSLVMAKLNRLIERQRQMGEDYSLPRDTPLPRLGNRMGYRMSVTCFGTAAVMFLMVWRPAVGAEGLGLPFAQHVTALQLGLLALAALISGCVLAAAGWVKPVDQELIYNGMGTPRRSLPVGLLLAVFGAIFLPLALGIYLVIGYLQQAVSGSVLAAIFVAGILAVGFGLTVPTNAQGELMLVGGNLSFISLLVGWFLGDLFRPAWAL